MIQTTLLKTKQAKEVQSDRRNETDDKTNCRRYVFLGQKPEPAIQQDTSVGQDLQGTLKADQDRCVGMAANMIGVKKRIIIVNINPMMNLVIYNPVILKKDTPYETEEGCLSLDGIRKTI